MGLGRCWAMGPGLTAGWASHRSLSPSSQSRFDESKSNRSHPIKCTEEEFSLSLSCSANQVTSSQAISACEKAGLWEAPSRAVSRRLVSSADRGPTPPTPRDGGSDRDETDGRRWTTCPKSDVRRGELRLPVSSMCLEDSRRTILMRCRTHKRDG